jgi:GTPase SAR1 family protein
MFWHPTKQLSARVESLRAHLANENPILVDVVGSFQELDKVAYRMGLLDTSESFATRISWWPMIAVLGTYSAGKSTFINQYLGTHLQQTGNQAVDDRFTVICYSSDDEVRVLPGLSLDADPRFPFYQISQEIDKVASSEGDRINAYLQLKTCPSDSLRGKIFIDSPGFDADEQRNSTLRITDHIIDLSDLVLVFFDARHPEPGAMQDTLAHLVSGTVHRNDANKVLFILNQVDATAREDNAEDVIAAWQRAIAKGGVASGRFYTVYIEQAAVPIENEELRRRYQAKRDADLAEIYQRISQVSVERVYRIVGSLDSIANRIEKHTVPQLRAALERWYRRVMTLDLIIVLPILAVLLGLSISAGYWEGLSFSPPWLDALGEPWMTLTALGALIVAGILGIHFWVRSRMALRIARTLADDQGPGSLSRAFLKNTRVSRSVFRSTPVGWGRASRKRIDAVRQAAGSFIQKLNDRYADPSGGAAEQAPVMPVLEAEDEVHPQPAPQVSG